jgi:uncharacterized lipoprotein YehR (DUF1307 family)
MTVIKTLLTLAVAAVASVALTGCGTLERAQDLRDANPAAYEAITGEANYAAQNAQFNVHGS